MYKARVFVLNIVKNACFIILLTKVVLININLSKWAALGTMETFKCVKEPTLITAATLSRPSAIYTIGQTRKGQSEQDKVTILSNVLALGLFVIF